jgi:hypothetical protein
MNTLKLSLASLILAAIFYPVKTIAENTDYSRYYVNDTDLTIDKIQTELSEDGEWIKINPSDIDPESVTDGSDDIDEGINTDWVWRPYDVGPAWSPYTNGYWKYTSCGWMWVSYYHWGWRPYHYGRWWWSPVYGWVWSPGYIWAPAWVVWFFHPSYCGWYPLPPRACRYHYRRYRCHNIRFRVRHWTFCPTYNFTTVIINNTVIVPPEGNTEIIKGSTFETGIEIQKERVINNGPGLKEIEGATGSSYTAENVDRYNNVKFADDSKMYKESTKRDNTGSKDDNRYDNSRSNEKSRSDDKSPYEDVNKNRETKQDKSYENRDYENKRNDENKNYENRNGEKSTNDYEKSRNDNSQKQRGTNQPEKNREYKQPESKKENKQEYKREYKAPEQKQEYKAPEKNREYKQPEQKQENKQENRESYKRDDNNSRQNDSPPPTKKKESPPPEKKNDDNGSRNNDSPKNDNGSKGNGKR